jgi:hypothetical protein
LLRLPKPNHKILLKNSIHKLVPTNVTKATKKPQYVWCFINNRLNEHFTYKFYLCFKRIIWETWINENIFRLHSSVGCVWSLLMRNKKNIFCNLMITNKNIHHSAQETKLFCHPMTASHPKYSNALLQTNHQQAK